MKTEWTPAQIEEFGIHIATCYVSWESEPPASVGDYTPKDPDEASEEFESWYQAVEKANQIDGIEKAIKVIEEKYFAGPTRDMILTWMYEQIKEIQDD